MLRGILVVVIDCLRADHVSAWGYNRPTTPTLDKLAASGIRWTHAQAASSWTKPSVSSLLTGRYPSEHGVYEGIKRRRLQPAPAGDDGRWHTDRIVTTDVLPAMIPTVAEQLSTLGWRCGAFINNAQLGEFSGLSRGFDCYQPTAGKADAILAALGDWLDAEPQRPFFAYLHLLEAHWPYKPRRRHVRAFGGNRDTNPFAAYSARDFGRLRRAISRGQATLSEGQLRDLIVLYDAAVRRLDGKLKLLLAALEQRSLHDSVALFVTADHGEEFLDHGKIGHGQSLYQELVHVPLVGRVPDGPEGAVIDTPISHVELSPMWLSLARGDSGTAGHHLLTAAPNRPVVSELRVRRRYEQALRDGRWKLIRRWRFADDAARLRSPRALARSGQADLELELYDLERDPREQHDLARAPQQAGTLRRLVSQLDAWWEALEVADESCERQVDHDLEQRLRALGYVE